jgi:hypothetical protein
VERTVDHDDRARHARGAKLIERANELVWAGSGHGDLDSHGRRLP